MKLTPEQFEQFTEQTRTYLIVNKTWRCGQAMFNALVWIHPELARDIRGTELDPFYQNGRIGAFMRHICADEQYDKLNPAFKNLTARISILPEVESFGQTLELYTKPL